MSDYELGRDELIALMIAELDARLNGRGDVTVLAWPDRENDDDETVELIARDTGGEVVVEHTRIESYPGQIDDHTAVHDYFDRGGPGLPDAGDLGGHLMLGVPIQEFSRSVPPRKRRPAGNRITDWVRGNADRAEFPQEPGSPAGLSGSHCDIPFVWTLTLAVPSDVSLIGPLADVVRVSFARPADLEVRRIERVGLALLRKLRKLLAAAGDNRRSILVLEDRDPATRSPLSLSRATHASSASHALPDVIYVLNTRAGNPTAGVLYAYGLWAHERPFFRSETFDDPPQRTIQRSAVQLAVAGARWTSGRTPAHRPFASTPIAGSVQLSRLPVLLTV